MNGRERMLAAVRGEPVDRAPIWLREGFTVVGEPADADSFNRGWQADPLYRELHEYVRPHIDDFAGWSIGGQNRLVMVHPSAVSHEPIETGDGDVRRNYVHVDTPRGRLTGIQESRRGEATGWAVKHVIETREELKMIMEVPWELTEDMVAKAKQNYRNTRAKHGDKFPLRTGCCCPAVCISGAMKFELFLELTVTDNAWFHEILAEVTRRKLAILQAVFDEPIETAVNFGGSEQCTPPMMRPEAYDEFVKPYDGQLVDFFKAHDVPVCFHCHGKVKHALKNMVEMGVDATDPVEPPPAGDVTYAEARAIAGDDLTLIGNLEWDQLEFAEPREICRQVKEILSHGNRRLILAASAGPISAMSRKLVDNYKAWVDTALEYG